MVVIRHINLISTSEKNEPTDTFFKTYLKAVVFINLLIQKTFQAYPEPGTWAKTGLLSKLLVYKA